LRNQTQTRYRTHKVTTKDGRQLTITEKITTTPAHNDEEMMAFIPEITTRKLHKVNGKKFEGDCDVRYELDRITLLDGTKVQHLKIKLTEKQQEIADAWHNAEYDESKLPGMGEY